MFELLTDPNAWLSFAALTVLEIVLGIDNIIFIAIVTGRLPENRQGPARRFGLSIAVSCALRCCSASSGSFP